MRRILFSTALVIGLAAASVVATGGGSGSGGGGGPKFSVSAAVFDPARSHLVASQWISGIGCPTNQAFDDVTYAIYYPAQPPSPYSDPACLTGDPSDRKVEGLLLAKTGLTYNNASAGATIDGVKNIKLTELGYDIRKAVDPVTGQVPNVYDPRGSHCGAGAPRFNVVTKPAGPYTAGIYYSYIACIYASSASGGPDGGFIRLRWGNGTIGSVYGYAYDLSTSPATFLGYLPITDKIKSIEIVMDEAQDAYGGPDRFGVAILDNIDVNQVLMGRGSDNGKH